MGARTPDWVKDAVFYQIFPDRFARSARAAKPSGLEPWDSPPTRFGFKGGDLYGVAERLPYLQELGVTAIYFNPIFQSASNHRYHTHDYYRIDPILGGENAFDELLRVAHDAGIHVVLDGVFNHASRGFYQFQQTLENGSSSPYLDWFYFEGDLLAPGVGPYAYPEPHLHREKWTWRERRRYRRALARGETPDRGETPALGEAIEQGDSPDRGADGLRDAVGSGAAGPYGGGAGAPEADRPEARDDHPNAADLAGETGLPVNDGGSRNRYGYFAWWDIPALPKFNTDTPAVREFLLDVGEYWIRRGADGWRLDVPGEIDDDEFWREFRRRVKAANPDAYIVGELWDNAERWLAGDQFDAVMNYVFNRLCYRFFGARSIDPEHSRPGGHELRPVDAPGAAFELEALLSRYDREITEAQLNLLSSHDEPRFLTVVSGDRAAFRLATAFQMTIPGAPCIYYGDEIGMEGGSDPDCRRTFPEDRSAWDEELLDWTKALTALRHSRVALRRGALRTVIAEGEVFGYLRTHRDGWALVVFNAGDSAWRGSIALHDALAALPDDDARPNDGAVDIAARWCPEGFEGDDDSCLVIAEGAVEETLLPARSVLILAP